MRAASGYHWSQQISTPMFAYLVFQTRKPFACPAVSPW